MNFSHLAVKEFFYSGILTIPRLKEISLIAFCYQHVDNSIKPLLGIFKSSVMNMEKLNLF